jgi:hypothetical protein
MTAELKTFPDPAQLLAFVNALYAAGKTGVVVTLLKPSVYLIQHTI